MALNSVTMRRFLQKILSKPVIWLANRFSSAPNMKRVHTALSRLYAQGKKRKGKKVLVLDKILADTHIIIFSDQHKGTKNGNDDFNVCEPAYLAALEYYNARNFHLISLGDEEELWENRVWPVKQHNKATIDLQQKFLEQNRYTKVYGNHDLFWHNDPFAGLHLKGMYGMPVPIYEAVLLNLRTGNEIITALLTHGHQGDGQSDGNWFSAWFVSRIWAPLQAYLGINPNTPSVSTALKTKHNYFMYQWSEKEHHPLLITGHTHQPVFASLTHLERLYKKLDHAKQNNDTVLNDKISQEIKFKQSEYDYVIGNYKTMKPYYFNTGCCCFSDGDITGIEITAEKIRLIKWSGKAVPERMVLEEMDMGELWMQ